MCRLSIIFAAVLATLSITLPLPLQAAENVCSCYCAVEGTGATRYPKGSEKVGLTSAACQETCRKVGYGVAACAYSSDQLPSQNVMCFTSSQCSKMGGVFGSSQPGECLPQSGYCYPDPKKRIETNLQVSIGDLDVTGDLGEYISTVYTWMLGAGTTIAIIFVMVSGLRWTLGGMNAEQIGSAKKKITSAVVGLVLLLSTYLIIATVNPSLLRLQVPAFPMIRQVALIDDETSCGYLTGKYGSAPYLKIFDAPSDSPHAVGQPAPKGGTSYELEDPTNNVTECGSVASIVKDWQGAKVMEGTTCTYNYCKVPGYRCVGSGSNALCASCDDYVSQIKAGVGSGKAVSCGKLSYSHVLSSDGKVSTAYYCEAFEFSVVEKLDPAMGANILDGFCGKLKIECNTIKSCKDYEYQQMANTSGDALLTFVEPVLQKVCSEDPCLVGQATGKTCTFEEGILYSDCVSK